MITEHLIDNPYARAARRVLSIEECESCQQAIDVVEDESAPKAHRCNAIVMLWNLFGLGGSLPGNLDIEVGHPILDGKRLADFSALQCFDLDRCSWRDCFSLVDGTQVSIHGYDAGAIKQIVSDCHHLTPSWSTFLRINYFPYGHRIHRLTQVAVSTTFTVPILTKVVVDAEVLSNIPPIPISLPGHMTGTTQTLRSANRVVESISEGRCGNRTSD